MASWLSRIVCAGAAAACLSGPAAAESLADAFVLAYRNSNLLEQNRALLRAADEGVAQAVAATRPAIGYAVSSSFANTYSSVTTPDFIQSLSATVAVTAEITLFDFGRNRLSIDVARETVLATRNLLTQIEQNVLLATVEAYMGVLSAIEIVSLRENNVRLITQELRAAQDRFEVGEITRTDVAIAEARLASARAGLAAARGELEIAREAYRLAVGKYPGPLYGPPAPPMTARTEAAAKALAVRTHPAIRQAQHEVTAAELSIAIAETAMKPTIAGSLSVTGTGRNNLNVSPTGPGATSNSLSAQAGVTLVGPIYQGGGLTAALRRAIAQRDGSRAALLQTTLEVQQRVGNAWARLAVAHATLEASLRQVRAAQIAYDGVREEARLGARTTLDVLNAEQELLDARAARITAETDRYVAIYSLLAAMGLLTVEHLNLGIPTYDPEAYFNAVKDAPVREVSPQGEQLDRVLRRLGKD